MKNFGIIFWIMIVIAGCLSVTTTYMIDSRMDEMETNIEEINSMNVSLKPSTWEAVHEMVFDVVNNPKGTAFDLDLARSKIKVFGKTGTAENPHGEPHAWFVGFAKYNKQIISISIIIENGGTGGSTAAPIATALIKNYFGINKRNLPVGS